MREPRPRQRFPNSGKHLYALLRQDYEPLWIHVMTTESNWKSGWYEPVGMPRRKIRSPREYMDDQERQAPSVYLLTYEAAFDPMLYFWPVERQHVIVNCRAPMDADTLRRLVKAMERDGVGLLQTMWPDAVETRRSLEPRGIVLQTFGEFAE